MKKFPFFEQKNMSGWKRWLLPSLIAVLLAVLVVRTDLQTDPWGFFGQVAALGLFIWELWRTSDREVVSQKLDAVEKALEREEPWKSASLLIDLLAPTNPLSQRIRNDPGPRERARQLAAHLREQQTCGRILGEASRQARARYLPEADSVLAKWEILFTENDPFIPASDPEYVGGDAKLPMRLAIQSVRRLLTDNDKLVAEKPRDGFDGLVKLFATWDVLTADLFAAALPRLLTVRDGHEIVVRAFQKNADLRRLLNDPDVRHTHDDLKKIALKPGTYRYYKDAKLKQRPSEEILAKWSLRLASRLGRVVNKQAGLIELAKFPMVLEAAAFATPLMLRCKNETEAKYAVARYLADRSMERFPLVLELGREELSQIESEAKLLVDSVVEKIYRRWVELLSEFPHVYQDMTEQNHVSLAKLFVHTAGSYENWRNEMEGIWDDAPAAHGVQIERQLVIDDVKRRCPNIEPKHGFNRQEWLALRPAVFDRSCLIFTLGGQAMTQSHLRKFRDNLDENAGDLRDLCMDVMVLIPERVDPDCVQTQPLTWTPDDLANTLNVWVTRLLPGSFPITFEEALVVINQESGDRPLFTVEHISNNSEKSLVKLVEILEEMLRHHLQEYPPEEDDGRLTLEDALSAGIIPLEKEAQ